MNAHGLGQAGVKVPAEATITIPKSVSESGGGEQALTKLKVGDLLSARVVSGAKDAHTGTPAKGLNISGTFVAAELPEDYRNGDRVTVQVVSKEPQLKIKITPEHEAASRATSAQTAEATESIKNILKALNISEQELSQLQQFARNVRQLASESENSNAKVLNDELLKNPEKLKAALSEQAGKQASETQGMQGQSSAQALSSDKAQLERQLSPESRQALKQIEAELERVLKGLSSSVAKEAQSEGGAASGTEKIQNLLNTLSEISDSPLSVKALEEAVKGQVDGLKELEAFIKQKLFSEKDTGLYEQFKQTLSAIEERMANLSSPKEIDIDLLNFVRKLNQDLNLAEQGKSLRQTIPKLLEDALKFLHQRFSVNSESDLSSFKPNELLSQSSQVYLKEIEAQLKLLLTKELNPFGEKLNSLFKWLEQLRDNLSGREDVNKLFTKLFSDIQEAVGGLFSSGVSGQVDSEVFEKLFKRITEILTSNREELGKLKIGTEAKAGQGSEGVNQSLFDVFSKIKDDLQGVIEIIQQLNSGAEARAQLLQNVHPAGGESESAVAKLINLLKAVKAPGAEAASQLDFQFFNFVTELSRELEAHVAAGNAQGSIRETIQKALQTLHKHFTDAGSTKNNAKLETIKKEALKNIDNFMKGQELLRQLNPLMQAAGEPAMMLFPAFMQGFLSQLEVSYFSPQDKVPVSGEQKKQDQKGHEGELEHIKIQLDLPSLGAVTVDLAHNEESLLLNFTLDEQEKADFVEGFVSKLSERLKSRAYKKLEINVKAGKADSVRPEWFDALVKSSMVIA
jgi:hypothetical protein